jgi:hypothetical protein
LFTIRRSECGLCCGSGSGYTWIRIDLGRLDPDPDPGAQKLPTKIEKRTEFSCFEVLDVLF